MDTCNQLYFHTDLYINLMELKIIETELSGFGFPNSIFFDNYFEIINYHNIIAGDFSFEIETSVFCDMKILCPFLSKRDINELKDDG